jgi:chromosome segregation ATPase
MENAVLFTALLLGAAVLGSFIGACCSKGRQAGDCEGRIAELEDRLDALADHCMEEAHKLRERVDELEFLMGETPTGGLLGRVGALEEARRREDLLGRVNRLTDSVNVLIDDVQELEKGLEGLQMVNDAEHHALLEHQKCIVKDTKEAQDGR